MVEIRGPNTDDVRQLGSTMARAFQDDPAFGWATANAGRRERFGPRYFELLIARIYLPKGEVYMGEGGTAMALWAPPDKWQTPMSASLPLLPVMLRLFSRRLAVALRMLTSMETRHKTQSEPHYYLPFIGTDPDHQGKGQGTALLTDMLRRCDEEGRPAHLESTRIENRALYHRHGFQVLDEMHWPMWREPRGT